MGFSTGLIWRGLQIRADFVDPHLDFGFSLAAVEDVFFVVANRVAGLVEVLFVNDA